MEEEENKSDIVTEQSTPPPSPPKLTKPIPKKVYPVSKDCHRLQLNWFYNVDANSN